MTVLWWLESIMGGKKPNWQLVNTTTVLLGMVVTVVTVYYQIESNNEAVLHQIQSNNQSVAVQIQAASFLEAQRRRYETRRFAYEELAVMVVRLSELDLQSADYKREYMKLARHFRGVMRLYDDSTVYNIVARYVEMIDLAIEEHDQSQANEIRRTASEVIDTCRSQLHLSSGR